MLYSLPSFFVGTVLLLFFANPDTLLWFPESGIKDPIGDYRSLIGVFLIGKEYNINALFSFTTNYLHIWFFCIFKQNYEGRND